MGEKREFVRERREARPVIAICYDFDKTLSPDDMQAQGFIQKLGYEVEEFWNESNKLASSNDMDQALSYMFLMKNEAIGHVPFSKDKLAEFGKDVQLFKGVKEWFRRINGYGEDKGVIIEHYIISTGLKEMIEGTSIAGEFKRIYASSFYFERNGKAVMWPSQVVNYTNKTQYLFRIEKGILDVNDPGVNDYYDDSEYRVPFSNMVYIGDSDTDVPCMKLVKSKGGYSIGVFDPSKDKSKVYRMMHDGRIDFFAPADYSEGSELDELVKRIIDHVRQRSMLDGIQAKCLNELAGVEKEKDEASQEKERLILKLEESPSFKATHTIVSKMAGSGLPWTMEEKLKLYSIASSNTQVRYIMSDSDISDFYLSLLGGDRDSKEAKEILKYINAQRKRRV